MTRVGTLCYATDQGLGYLAKSFYDNGVVTDVLIVNHGFHPTHAEWYPGASITPRKVNSDQSREFAREMDAMLFFETPFDWPLLSFCREHKIRTVLMPMYECTAHPPLEKPDHIVCPSLLDLDYYPDGEFIPVPTSVPWRLRDRARVFVHNAGNLGSRWRNGTYELLLALPHIKSPIELIVRGQTIELQRVLRKIPRQHRNDPRLKIRVGVVPFEETVEGDVCLRPEKFNGLSMPLQEAACAGMLCMTTNRYPMNSWLPNAPMIPVTRYDKVYVLPDRFHVDEAIVEPRDIAATVDEWYDKDIREFSLMGKKIAEQLSWDVLKPKYMKALFP